MISQKFCRNHKRMHFQIDGVRVFATKFKFPGIRIKANGIHSRLDQRFFNIYVSLNLENKNLEIIFSQNLPYRESRIFHFWASQNPISKCQLSCFATNPRCSPKFQIPWNHYKCSGGTIRKGRLIREDSMLEPHHHHFCHFLCVSKKNIVQGYCTEYVGNFIKILKGNLI